VHNPNAPAAPITLRQLMTHTSSIQDDGGLLGSVNRSPIPLRSFLEDYLTPGHKYFKNSFFSYAPGAGFSYANTGAALAGLALETVEGQGYEAITQDRIFTPLGVRYAWWAPMAIPGAINATPYIDYKPIPPDEYPMLTPSGSLRTNTLDLARFLQMFMAGGAREGVRVLSAASVQEMSRQQIPQINNLFGLFWYTQHGYLGHAGGLAGTASYMFFQPGTQLGVIMMMNGHIANNESRDAEALQMMEEFFANAGAIS
jgi:CubicO group peptidase (beta-lactamase class C family)